MNFKLTIQYDGTDFHGWQKQGELRTVQGELTEALNLIEGQEVVLHGSGRTDAGVHAEGQVASVVISRQISAEKLQSAVNANVGADVRVVKAECVGEEFHARHSAREKTYVYRIVNNQVISPFLCRYAYLEGRHLDIERMRTGASLFIGTHDWTAFSSTQTDAESRVRTISHLEILEHEDLRAPGRVIEITVRGNGFLRYMVRSIAGTLLAVGRSEMDGEVVKQAIESGDRSLVAATAPPHGLTLVSVIY
jgi:tRNA pseudouridine38-40 synthase